MKCPECGASSKHLNTTHSYHTEDDRVRRRRICKECESRFSTIEIVVADRVDLKDSALTISPKGYTVLLVPPGVSIQDHDDKG